MIIIVGMVGQMEGSELFTYGLKNRTCWMTCAQVAGLSFNGYIYQKRAIVVPCLLSFRGFDDASNTEPHAWQWLHERNYAKIEPKVLVRVATLHEFACHSSHTTDDNV